VLADGKVVGRIYEDAHLSTPPDMRWVWSVTAIVPATTQRVGFESISATRLGRGWLPGGRFCSALRSISARR
jgi:hypothetical protein